MYFVTVSKWYVVSCTLGLFALLSPSDTLAQDKEVRIRPSSEIITAVKNDNIDTKLLSDSIYAAEFDPDPAKAKKAASKAIELCPYCEWQTKTNARTGEVYIELTKGLPEAEVTSVPIDVTPFKNHKVLPPPTAPSTPPSPSQPSIKKGNN